MTIRAHILDLKERRGAYADMLQALLTGKLVDGHDSEARIADLRQKIAALDVLIATEEERRAERS